MNQLALSIGVGPVVSCLKEHEEKLGDVCEKTVDYLRYEYYLSVA